MAFTDFLFVIGLIHAAYFVYAVLGMIRRHCLIRKKNLVHRYGGLPNEGREAFRVSTWALVTGASDGIGAEYCV